MKKLINLTLAFLLALSLVACGASNGVADDNVGEPIENETANMTEDSQESSAQPETQPDSDENTPAEDIDVPAAEKGQTEEQPEEQPVDEESKVVISASHTDVTFKAAGSSFRLEPRGINGEYTAAFLSANESIAAVVSDGTVTAVAPGTTAVTMQIEQNGVLYSFDCIVRCSWDETPVSDDQSNDIDLSAFFVSFMEGLGENAPFMMAAEGDVLDAFYPGLAGYSAKQFVVQMAAMSAVPFEFALIELENSGDVDAIKAILEARKAYQVDGGAWYPETIASWEKAEIIVIGNIVALIAAGDQQADAVAAYMALFDR